MALANWMIPADDPQVEEISVSVEGHRMRCLTAGRGPTLVLLQGLLASADAWRPCLSRLAEESSVYAVDSLGAGKSDRVPGLDASLSAQADRIAEFLDGAGIGCADVAGTSHGGAVAMMLAARHPERVRSLVLHAPANPFSTAADSLLRFYRTPPGRWFAYRTPHLPVRLQEMALKRMYGSGAHVRREALENYIGPLRVTGTVQHVLRILDCWSSDMHELRGALEKLGDVPVLLAWGTQDRVVSLESGRRLEKILPRAEMVVFPGVGHLPHDEAPALFAETVNGFLRRIDRGQAYRGPRLVTPSGPS